MIGLETPITLNGQQVLVKFEYFADEPFTIHLKTFEQNGNRTHWEFERELLIDGVSRKCGIGDVEVMPVLDHAVAISLRSPEGTATLRVLREPLIHFLADTIEEVMPGSEVLDLDACIEELLR